MENSIKKQRNGIQIQLLQLKKPTSLFAQIFNPEDVQPDSSERMQLDQNLKALSERKLIETASKITVRELKQAIKAANNRSASGPDKITNKILKIVCQDEEFFTL